LLGEQLQRSSENLGFRFSDDLFFIILAGRTHTASFLRNGIIGMAWIGMTPSEFLFGYKECFARYLSLKKKSSENQNLFSDDLLHDSAI